MHHDLEITRLAQDGQNMKGQIELDWSRRLEFPFNY